MSTNTVIFATEGSEKSYTFAVELMFSTVMWKVVIILLMGVSKIV
jgi:hypothetical protein